MRSRPMYASPETQRAGHSKEQEPNSKGGGLKGGEGRRWHQPGPGHMKEELLEPGNEEDNVLGTGQQGGGRVRDLRQGEQRARPER